MYTINATHLVTTLEHKLKMSEGTAHYTDTLGRKHTAARRSARRPMGAGSSCRAAGLATRTLPCRGGLTSPPPPLPAVSCSALRDRTRTPHAVRVRPPVAPGCALHAARLSLFQRRWAGRWSGRWAGQVTEIGGGGRCVFVYSSRRKTSEAIHRPCGVNY